LALRARSWFSWLTSDSRPNQLARVDSSTQSGAARPRRGGSGNGHGSHGSHASHGSIGEVSAALRAPRVRRTLIVVLVLNAVVALIKVIIGLRTGALTVLGAALESALDMLNNLIGVMLVDVAGRAPDEDHPYGHDKFETLGALGIVGFLSISCFELLRQGVVSLFHGAIPARIGLLEVASIVATLVINVFVVMYERRRGLELSSAFLMA